MGHRPALCALVALLAAGAVCAQPAATPGTAVGPVPIVMPDEAPSTAPRARPVGVTDPSMTPLASPSPLVPGASPSPTVGVDATTVAPAAGPKASPSPLPGAEEDEEPIPPADETAPVDESPAPDAAADASPAPDAAADASPAPGADAEASPAPADAAVIPVVIDVNITENATVVDAAPVAPYIPDATALRTNGSQCSWDGEKQACELSAFFILSNISMPQGDAVAAAVIKAVAANALCNLIEVETDCTANGTAGNCNWVGTSVSDLGAAAGCSVAAAG